MYDKLHAEGFLDINDEVHQAGKGRDTLYRRITAARRFKLSPGTLDTLDLSPISLIVKDVRRIESAILYSGNALNRLLVQFPNGVATIDGERWGTREAIARDYQIRWPKLQEITAPNAEVIDEEDGTKRPVRKKRNVLGVGPRGVRKYTLYSYSELDTLYCPDGILVEGDRTLMIPAAAKRELGIEWETIRRSHEYGHMNFGDECLQGETRFKIGPRGAMDYEFFDKALLLKIKEPKAKRTRSPLGRTATKRRQDEGEATIRIGIYRDGTTCVAILPEIAWLYHEASKPLAICRRAKVALNRWYDWLRLAEKHSLDVERLKTFLYGGSPTKAEAAAYRELGFYGNRRKEHLKRQHDVRKFRKQSHRKAVERAVWKANPKLGRFEIQALIRVVLGREIGLSYTNPGIDAAARRKTWIGRFLERGEKPKPEDQYVLTVAQVRKLYASFDYVGLGCDATYGRLFKEGLLPANMLEQLYEWIKCLFGGGDPDGWHTISKRQFDFRQKFVDSIDCRNRTEGPQDETNIAEVARSGDTTQSAYTKWLDKAKTPGCRSELHRYLTGTTTSSIGIRWSKYVGVIWTGDKKWLEQVEQGAAPDPRYPSGGLFSFGAKLLSFIEKAAKRASANGLWDMEKEIPCFQQIALDLALPQPKHGRRSAYDNFLPEELRTRRPPKAAVRGMSQIEDPQSADHLPGATRSRMAGEKAKQRGRKKADYETVQLESQLAANWRQAHENGVYKVEFAKERGMTLGEFDRLLDRVAARNRHSE